MEKLLLKNAQGLKTKEIPIWMMRQAGRYLPEYQAYRKTNTTLTMFQTPQIAADITLQPIRRFPHLDGAILYADILLIPDALGCGLHFIEGEGPKFEQKVETLHHLLSMEKKFENQSAFLDSLFYVFQTLEDVKKQLPPHVTLLGFAGAPFTVASYMIEGQGTGGELKNTKKMMFENKELFLRLMDLLTNCTIAYLKTQIVCGAEVIQLFESWSGCLSYDQYHEYCFPFLQKIVYEIQKQVPVITFFGESAHLLPLVKQLNPNVFSVDWRQNMPTIVDYFADKKIAFQGNLDPQVLLHSKAEIKNDVAKLKELFSKNDKPYIFNLGHGIIKNTPIENVEFLIEQLKSET